MLSALLCLLAYAEPPATCEHPGDTADAAVHQVEHLIARVETLETQVDQSISAVERALEVLRAADEAQAAEKAAAAPAANKAPGAAAAGTTVNVKPPEEKPKPAGS